MIACPECVREFDTQRGVEIHAARAHHPYTKDGLCEADGCPNEKRVQITHGVTHRRRYCSKHVKQRETQAAKARGNTCRITACDKPVSQTRSLCRTHLYRLTNYGDAEAPLPQRPPRSPTCASQGCDRPRMIYVCKGKKKGNPYCAAHRWRVRKYGQTFPEIPVPAPKGMVRAAALAAKQAA